MSACRAETELDILVRTWQNRRLKIELVVVVVVGVHERRRDRRNRKQNREVKPNWRCLLTRTT